MHSPAYPVYLHQIWWTSPNILDQVIKKPRVSPLERPQGIPPIIQHSQTGDNQLGLCTWDFQRAFSEGLSKTQNNNLCTTITEEFLQTSRVHLPGWLRANTLVPRGKLLPSLGLLQPTFVLLLALPFLSSFPMMEGCAERETWWGCANLTFS